MNNLYECKVFHFKHTCSAKLPTYVHCTYLTYFVSPQNVSVNRSCIYLYMPNLLRCLLVLTVFKDKIFCQTQKCHSISLYVTDNLSARANYSAIKNSLYPLIM